MANSYWLWYPGDLELYHAMKQNFSRVERGYGWPAFWKSEGFRNRVVFRRRYLLKQDTVFCVHSKAVGFVLVGEKKYPFGRTIPCPAGEWQISIHAAQIEAFPCIYIQGDVICSDLGWMVEDYAKPPVLAGHSRYFTQVNQDPACWDYSERIYTPVKTERVNGGTLYEFETELTAVLWVQCEKEQMEQITLYCGESREEALDRQHCYYSWKPDPVTGKCPRCAVRYVYIPGDEIPLVAVHQYVDIPVRATFNCGDPMLDQIWSVAEHTFSLCSGIFFIDGIKRDKWIWSGDAYQSFFVNRYLMADPDIDQRTILALRGNDPMTTHINTIVDYSLFWILGIKEHFDAYGDRAFLEQIYPKMQSLMEFCEKCTDEHGFLVARNCDWTFIDWADLDKDDPFGAVQMLLAACWGAMDWLSEALGRDGASYRQRRAELVRNIDVYYWDDEQGAYLDSFSSGRRHITRQTNIFAVLFHIANPARRERILKTIINSDTLPPITTPYFNFFELDMLAEAGALDQVMERLRTYWGGMLERGAVTFWEEFDPAITGPEQYDMYGDKFGKSLCHAWSASPIYLLSKYFAGLRQSGAGFILAPQLKYFSSLDCTLPIGSGDGFVRVSWDGKTLGVETNRQGGIVQLENQQHRLAPNKLWQYSNEV